MKLGKNYKKVFKTLAWGAPFGALAAVACSVTISNKDADGKEILYDAISAADLSFVGNSLSATVSLNSDKKLNENLELRYYVGTNEPSDDTYNATVPTNLKNGDVLYTKLFVKTGVASKYSINAAVIKVDLFDINREALNNPLNASNFDLIGTSTAKNLRFKGTTPTIDEKGQIRYYKGTSAPTNSSDYRTSLPSNIAESEKIWIKVSVKEGPNNLHYQDSPAIVLETITDSFTEDDFSISGSTSGQGTLTFDKTLVPQLELHYGVGDLRPAASEFSTVIPNTLFNNDKVWITTVLKASASQTYILWEKTVTKVITGLAKASLTETLVANDLNFLGADSQGTIGLAREINNKLEARFFKGSTEPTDDAAYQTSLKNLVNGDKVWAKLFVKDEYKDAYQISATTISKDVVLTSKVLFDELEIHKIEAIGTSGSGSLRIRTIEAISEHLELRYAVSATEPTDEANYSASLSTLSQGNKVWAKLFVKSSASGFSIDATAKSFTIYFSLSNSQFKNATLPDVVLANSITSIPIICFQFATLPSSFALPSSILRIEGTAFEQCNTGAAPFFLKYNQAITFVGTFAFSFWQTWTTTPIENRTLSSSFVLSDNSTIDTLPTNSFSYIRINSSFKIPPSVRILRNKVFQYSELPVGFTIPLTVTSLENEAFWQVFLPAGAAWFDKDNNRVINQFIPPIGSYIGLV